jgi:hypothetical protein
VSKSTLARSISIHSAPSAAREPASCASASMNRAGGSGGDVMRQGGGQQPPPQQMPMGGNMPPVRVMTVAAGQSSFPYRRLFCPPHVHRHTPSPPFVLGLCADGHVVLGMRRAAWIRRRRDRWCAGAGRLGQNPCDAQQKRRRRCGRRRGHDGRRNAVRRGADGRRDGQRNVRHDRGLSVARWPGRDGR